MTTYIIRRLLHAAVVILILSLLIFFAMRLLPGDPILMLITGDEFSTATPERIAMLRQEWGLDKPMLVQYVNWMADVLRGNLGTSIVHRDNITAEIMRRVPISMHLGLIAFVMGGLVGVVLGIVSAARRGKWIDSVVTVGANLLITAPNFWLGMLLIYVFGLHLKLLPIFGYTSPFTDFWMSTKQAIMPAFCLMAFPLASTVRQTRSSMLEVMRQDYVRTAFAKGLSERTVIARHAIKNALMPVVTLQGMVLRFVIGGSTIVETVFNIPGMGRMAVDAVRAQDYPVVQAITLLVGTITVLINLGVDLAYGWLDPRIRYE